MALSFQPETRDVWSVEQYLDHVAREVDIRDQASITESAPALRALANNRRFVIELINRELSDLASFQNSNRHTAQTLILGANTKFLIRANIWMPPKTHPTQRKFEDEVLSYLQPHDHNFDLLTVGYFGPGYETDIYDYDRSKVSGYVGEKVEIRHLERTHLTFGKVMFFRANQDIHIQMHPRSLSMSINLLGAKTDTAFREQFYFDIARGEISAFASTRTSTRGTLFHLAAEVGDGSTCDLLQEVAKTHPAPRSRAQAFEALTALLPDRADETWREATADPHEVVRRWAHAALARA